MAPVGFTVGDHAASVPACPAQMKRLGALVPPWLTAKSFEPLKTMPVGFASPALPAGIETTSDCGTPLPSYSVDLEVSLSATHTKPWGLNAMPQPLTRFGSTLAAQAESATRLVTVKLAPAPPCTPNSLSRDTSPLPLPPPQDTRAHAPIPAAIHCQAFIAYSFVERFARRPGRARCVPCQERPMPCLSGGASLRATWAHGDTDHPQHPSSARPR